jgi:divalent metal cation (Fe/Co/Zn/Cd) transporter
MPQRASAVPWSVIAVSVRSSDLTVRRGHKIAHEVENKVLKGLPQIAEVLVHVEPQEELVEKSRGTKHLA